MWTRRGKQDRATPRTLECKRDRSNVLKLYDVIRRNNEQRPEEQGRFYNFHHSRPILAIGCHGPLEGALHSAQYFHGRYVITVMNR